MKPIFRVVSLVLAAALLIGVFGCGGPNSPGSQQAEILKRMQTSHRNH